VAPGRNMSKQSLRRSALEHRRSMPAAARERADQAIASAAAAFAAGSLAPGAAGRVCAYAPMIGEPGGADLLVAAEQALSLVSGRFRNVD